MKHVLMVSVVGCLAAGASAQWCVPAGFTPGGGGGFSAPARSFQPATSFRPINRGHNFLGTPSQAPGRAFGINRNSLFLDQAVNITPQQPAHGGHGGHIVRGGISSPLTTVRGGFVESSGVSVRGEVSAGDVDIAFSLGGGFGKPCVPLPPKYCKPIRPVFPANGFVIPWWWGYSNPPQAIDGPVIIYTDAPTEPAPEPEVESEVELTAPERAAMLLRAGNASGAVTILRTYLSEDGSDAEAMRLLAVALLMDDRLTEASAMMQFAYEHDRSMADRPLGDGSVEEGDRTLRDAVQRAVMHANREDTPGAWLLVTVLMQAEGRERASLRMLDRAVDAGLGEHVQRAFEAALSG